MADPVAEIISGANRNPAKARWRHRTRVWQQNIEAGSYSTIAGNVQNQSITETGPLQVYFDLQLFQEQPGGDTLHPGWQPMKAPLQLETGRRYRVQVTTSPNENNAIQQMFQDLVTVNLDMNMFLRTSDVIPSLSLSNVNATIVADEEEVENFRHDFLLTVDSDCPVARLFLELVYEENSNEKIATRLPIELKGDYNEIDTTLWERVGIDSSVRPPETMALLHIETSESGKIRLTCWNRRNIPNRPDALPAIELPQIKLDSIAQFVNDPTNVQDIIDTIHDFFAIDVPQLAEWFFQMIQRHRENCCIVIVDETPANVPWEMLEIEDGEYLGAHAAVVRWTHAQYLSLRAMLQMQDKEQHIGKLLAYVTPEDQEHALHCPILSQLASKSCPSEEELKVYLSPQELPKVGLVYLGHTGSFIYGNEPDQLRQNFYNRYGDPVKLRFDRVQAPSGKGPVVFVNASYSARILWAADKPYGLLKVLLAKFAAGYIGTLSAVEPQYAARYAQDILNDVNSSSDCVVLSDLLRLRRNEAATRYTMNPALLTNKLEFLYAFLYVYYGNPFAQLCLTDESHGNTQQE